MIGRSVTITGDRQLDRALVRLEAKVARKAITRGLRSAAKKIQAEAVARAPMGSGPKDEEAHARFGTKPLRDSIKVRRTKRTRRKTLGILVKLGGESAPEKPGAFYGAFKAFGTRKMGKDGFMDEAWQARKEAARGDVINAIRAELNMGDASP